MKKILLILALVLSFTEASAVETTVIRGVQFTLPAGFFNAKDKYPELLNAHDTKTTTMGIILPVTCDKKCMDTTKQPIDVGFMMIVTTESFSQKCVSEKTTDVTAEFPNNKNATICKSKEDMGREALFKLKNHNVIILATPKNESLWPKYIKAFEQIINSAEEVNDPLLKNNEKLKQNEKHN